MEKPKSWADRMVDGLVQHNINVRNESEWQPKTSKLVKVGITNVGYWEEITEKGFLNDFPGSTFTMYEVTTIFSELSQGFISMPQNLSEAFIKIKKEQTILNGGKWIIWD